MVRYYGSMGVAMEGTKKSGSDILSANRREGNQEEKEGERIYSSPQSHHRKSKGSDWEWRGVGPKSMVNFGG